MNMMDLATTLFGRTRAEENIVSTDATTRTYIGTATSDSSDGSVYVALSEDVTMPDDYDGEHGVGVEMPTTVGVSEGDDVVVTVFGGGTMKAPVVTGNPGWGDAVQEQVNNAESIAEQAEAVANATGQHFWPDDDGVHVTEVTQDEWNDSTGSSYHSGANVLLNALGQLFRDGLNNLLSLTTGKTYTETFQIRSGEDYYYELTYRPMAVESVTVDGTATSDYTWTNSGHVVGSGKLGTLVLGYDTWYANPGATLSVTYRTSPAMTVWDGLGNLAANVMSYFTADEIGLGGNIFADPHGTSRGAAVRFFGATDEQGASLTSGIQRDSGIGYISYVDTIGLTGTTTDEGAALSNGCISDYGIEATGYLYDDSESSNDYRVESTATLRARSRSSDAYDAADATARLGVKTVTIGDSGEHSYVTLGDGTGEDTEVPMEQAINVLSSPVTLFTGTYAQTHSAVVTLSESAANFSRIEFICENNDGERTSVTVTDPNGKNFNVVMVTIGGPTGTGTYAYMKAKSFSINGTSVTCRTYTYNGQTIYRHGSVTLRNGVAVAATQASEEIGIVKVLGWR